MSDLQRADLLLDQLTAERARGLRVQRMVGGGILLIVGFFMFNAWYRINNFDGETFMASLQQHASKTVLPRLQSELEDVGKEAVPAMTAALTEGASSLLPKVSAAMAEEAAIFQSNLGSRMESSLRAAFLSATADKKAALKDSVGRFAKNSDLYDQTVESLQVASQSWAQRQLDTTFEKHVKLLSSINDTVALLSQEARAESRANGEAATMDEVMLLFMDILNTRLGTEG